MKPFCLTDFMNGSPAQMRKGIDVQFVHLSNDDIPAKLTVGVGSSMEYYFSNGSWLGTNFEHDNDLVMTDTLPRDRKISDR